MALYTVRSTRTRAGKLVRRVERGTCPVTLRRGPLPASPANDRPVRAPSTPPSLIERLAGLLERFA